MHALPPVARVRVRKGGEEGQVRLRLPFVEKPSKNWLLSPHGSHHRHPCVVDSSWAPCPDEREGEILQPPFIYWNFRPGRLYGLLGSSHLGVGIRSRGWGIIEERGFRAVCETNIYIYIGGEVLINERCAPRHLLIDVGCALSLDGF